MLDPFAGCATACVAAERLGRQWVGMDIWDRAYQTVADRMAREHMAPKGAAPRLGQQAFNATIYYETTPPPEPTMTRFQSPT